MVNKLFREIYQHFLKTRSKIKWIFKNLTASLIWPFAKDKKIKNINIFEQKIYSQNGEDGILKIIFNKIGVTNKFCVEFGVEDGTVCNTRYFIEKQGWDFLHMDQRKNLPPSIKKESVTAENINSLFKKYKVPEKFDLLSIDIDSNDYWVWKAISRYSPRVVVIEYNASIPPTESKAIKYNPKVRWDGTNYFGASLLALANLGKTKGYTLIGCDSRGINAFFIKNDLIKNNFVIKSVKEIYRPPRYGEKVNGKHVGHPPSNKSMIPV